MKKVDITKKELIRRTKILLQTKGKCDIDAPISLWCSRRICPIFFECNCDSSLQGQKERYRLVIKKAIDLDIKVKETDVFESLL